MGQVIDFTKMSFNLAVKVAAKEFGLDQSEAEEFINLVQGGESDDMNITEKAGNSTGAKKGWAARLRGGAKKFAGQAAQAGLGAVYGASTVHGGIEGSRGKFGHAVGSAGLALGAAALANKLNGNSKLRGKKRKMSKTFYGGAAVGAAGRALGPSIAKAIRNRKNRYKSPMDKKGQINASAKWKEILTTKAGNSAGVKKAWASRKRGVVGKIGSSFGKAVAGTARNIGTVASIPGHAVRIAKGVAGRTISAPVNAIHAARTGISKAGNSAIKFAKKHPKAVAIGAASLGAAAFGLAGRSAHRKFMKSYNTKKTFAGEAKLGNRPKGYVPTYARKEYNEAEMSLTITKDAKDQWRWTLLSTNAFEDRDGEVISQKALERDLETSEARYKEVGDYGPLRWWHVVLGPDPVKDGLDIGRCDFRGLEDRIMVESGTFDNEELGAMFAQHAKELGGSVGFMHSTSEPDDDKVFHSIRIFERSLLPRERASNPLAQLIIEKEGGIMLKEKMEKLQEILGGQDKAEKVIGKAKEAQAAAEAEGVRTKEVVTTKDEDVQVDASDTELTQEEWEGFVEAVGTAMEELLEDSDESESETKEVDELKATLKELNDGQGKLADALMKIDMRLKNLEGEKPKGTNFSASTDSSTVTSKEHAEPKVDPLNSFMDGFILKK